ncbi:HAD-like protein [Exidia glandulosa HHB12029]|uniref:HAD-like protein n=1 Tax=Exidia glandulosa HHB12029 TaxID=1314781 RepID=A0A166A4E0_EXIGL|nr:HAD-like protein [Exidia glandulosa HHB12029]
MSPRVEYVLFDLDGLLIDSEAIYTAVTNEILAPYGCEMTWEIKAGLMGKNEQAAAAHLFAALPPIALTPEAYLVQRRGLQDQRWPRVQLLPGAAKLIAHLHSHGIPMAIATGSNRAEFKLKTAHLSVTFGVFGENVVCADDPRMYGRKSKPAPDVFLQAAQLLGRGEGEGSKGLVFEDAIPGVQAAVAAGMNVVWIPDPRLQQVAGADTTPVVPPETRRLASLEDFKPEEYGLPPYSAP